MTKFTIQKDDLSQILVHPEQLPTLKEGEVLFSIKKYAFTANNLTYAVLGERLKYWHFFPAQAATQGIIPVWGFAEVIASTHAEIKVGEYCYGYFPMAKYLVVEADRVSTFGFTDKAAHRQPMASVYNYYNRCANDPTYKAEVEDFIPLLKPLFVTSFLNYYFLEDAQFHQAEQIILTSASSKTALGLAFMLKHHQKSHSKKIIALTSEGNLEFVKNTNYYDEVLPYQNIDTLTLKDSLVVDFAGNVQHLKNLSTHLATHLKYNSLVGLADWKAERNFKEIPNAEVFFAPAYAKIKFDEWGIAQTNERIAQYFFLFVEAMQDNIELAYLTSPQDVTKVYAQMLEGTLDPSKGYLVKTTTE